MKISLICPLHNEEKTAKKTFESVKNQTLQPDEIILIEDSSTDKTMAILEDIKKDFNNLRVFQVQNKNISKNRNFAISKSKGELIISIDSGCVLDKNYIKNIARVFNDTQIEFAGGFSKISPRSLFDKCFAEFVVKKPKNNFIPKGHAIAFKKGLWDKLGRFPEHLALGAEDTYFGKKAIKKGIHPLFVEDAIIYWETRIGYKTIFKQFQSYGYWDVKAFGFGGIPLNSKKALLVAIIFPLAIIHSFIKGFQLLKKFRRLQAFSYGILIDLTKIYGYVSGLIKGVLR